MISILSQIIMYFLQSTYIAYIYDIYGTYMF